MNIKDVRHQHLLEEMAKFGKDELFLEALNQGLATHPDYKSGFSASYLSQLKVRDRNIGDRTARKLEYGLGLAPNDFDKPATENDAGLDREFEALVSASTPAQRLRAIRSIADSVSPQTAMEFARVFLARAESGL